MPGKYNRVVIKVGTTILAHDTGLLNLRQIGSLTKTLADIKNSGVDVILVTSGAIGVGAGKLGLRSRPSDIPTKQACAAVGQSSLMNTYQQEFSRYHHNIAQILLTRDVVESDTLAQNVRNTFERLLELGVIPVVNENDTVSTDEIRTEDHSLSFGENDTLSAIVAILTNADLLVMMTDIDGLYDCCPKENPDAKLITHVDSITDKIRELAGGAGSSLGTGGMATKITAAEIAVKNGIPAVIMNGRKDRLLYDLLEGKNIGTIFKC
ncbi:MAG: glutamate 5-kinase [Oscillospiraceae bacterium]|nr:glutamate 5-kinase [Oscillospiraceae bacterium]